MVADSIADGDGERGRFTYHGGDLGAARAVFPGAPEPWIDLSTGINPVPYPLPAIDPRPGRPCPTPARPVRWKPRRRGPMAPTRRGRRGARHGGGHPAAAAPAPGAAGRRARPHLRRPRPRLGGRRRVGRDCGHARRAGGLRRRRGGQPQQPGRPPRRAGRTRRAGGAGRAAGGRRGLRRRRWTRAGASRPRPRRTPWCCAPSASSTASPACGSASRSRRRPAPRRCGRRSDPGR